MFSASSADNDFYSIRNYLREKRPALFYSWLDFPYELTERLMRHLTRLRKFRFKKHRHYNWSERIFEVCAFGKEADKKSEQSLAIAAGSDPIDENC